MDSNQETGKPNWVLSVIESADHTNGIKRLSDNIGSIVKAVKVVGVPSPQSLCRLRKRQLSSSWVDSADGD